MCWASRDQKCSGHMMRDFRGASPSTRQLTLSSHMIAYHVEAEVEIVMPAAGVGALAPPNMGHDHRLGYGISCQLILFEGARAPTPAAGITISTSGPHLRLVSGDTFSWALTFDSCCKLVGVRPPL
eukprot:913728-Prorocentrum_minimum.AAC.1